MKCPFCQQELSTGNYYVHCHNPHCNITTEMEGTEEMWDALIRTRKALEIAVDALKDNLSQANFREMLDASRFHCIRTKCELALEQITALEQKE